MTKLEYLNNIDIFDENFKTLEDVRGFIAGLSKTEKLIYHRHILKLPVSSFNEKDINILIYSDYIKECKRIAAERKGRAEAEGLSSSLACGLMWLAVGLAVVVVVALFIISIDVYIKL